MLCVLPPQTRTGQIRNVAWIADMSGYNFLFLFGKQVSLKQIKQVQDFSFVDLTLPLRDSGLGFVNKRKDSDFDMKIDN